jgi:hypothetical protein
MRAPTSEAFRRWFGNSVVRNADGSPKVVYHGTTAVAFTAFRPFYRKGEQLGFGIGHFAESLDFAARYAFSEDTARKGKGEARVYSVYLSVQSPLVAPAVVIEGTPEFALAKKLAGARLLTQTDEQGRKIAYLQNAIDKTQGKRAEALIRDAGYDGVVYQATLLSPDAYGVVKTGESLSWIAFEPWQVKSVDNAGAFDPSDSDILNGFRRRR